MSLAASQLCLTTRPLSEGLLTGAKENAVRGCIDRLQTLLARATKKRPVNPPNLLAGAGSGPANEPFVDEKTKFKQVKTNRVGFE